MVDRKYLVPVARRHALRRGIVLSSVAGLAVAAAIAAPLVPKTSIPALVNNAAAAETAHAPDSFADLVARVKPAVISIRVKMANDDSAALGQGDKFEFPHGTPFDRFFRQFDFPKMPGGPQAITGEGSGFFISADGYAVTNYHVVDHAKSVEVTTDGGKSYKAKVVGTVPGCGAELNARRADASPGEFIDGRLVWSFAVCPMWWAADSICHQKTDLASRRRASTRQRC